MPSSGQGADATPVVFVHGIGGGSRLWDPQIASFAVAGFRPIALDLPGYGARPPVERMDFASLAADVEASIERLALDRPILIGHSMGGMVAQALLRRRPQGYRAAVLSCTSPAFGNPNGEFQKKFVADRLRPLDCGKTMGEIAPDMVARLMGPAPDASWRQHAVETVAATSPQSFRAAVHCLLGFDERASLGSIEIPVLCLAGEHDRQAPPPVMERMAGKIPGARYVCLAGVGHLPNLEAPHAFDAAVFAFLSAALSSAVTAAPET